MALVNASREKTKTQSLIPPSCLQVPRSTKAQCRDTQASMRVSAEPPNESLSTLVSFELR
eukprot:1136619-Pelagomonas_calceolata.AAC.8